MAAEVERSSQEGPIHGDTDRLASGAGAWQGHFSHHAGLFVASADRDAAIEVEGDVPVLVAGSRHSENLGRLG